MKPNKTLFQVLGVIAAGALVYQGIRKFRLKNAEGFTNKVVVITGGSRGLGLEMARELYRESATIVLLARDEEELRRAAEELYFLGAKVHTYVCDLRDPEQIAFTFNLIESEVGPVDVLINNAGVIQMGPFENMSEEDFEESLDLHFWAVMRAVKAVLPSMKERRKGKIVNIASLGGKMAQPHLTSYCASKFALVGFSNALTTELQPYGIDVTSICPGFLRTGSLTAAQFKGSQEDEFQWFAVGGSLPGLSMSSKRAARKILEEAKLGSKEVILSIPTSIVVRLTNLFPNLIYRALGFGSRVLPEPNFAGGFERKEGRELRLRPVNRLLSQLSLRAGKRNNEAPLEKSIFS